MFENLQKLLNNEKIIYHYIDRYNKNENELGPLAVEFHWTSACNYDCMHCSYGSRRQDKGKLTEEIVENTIADLIELGTKAVYLSGGGEPITFPKWDQFSKQMLDNNIDLALITNAVLINEQQLELVRQMNYIAISIYSIDEEGYKIITGSNKFDEQFTLPQKIKSKPYRSVVGARCVINSTNYMDIIAIYEKAIISQFDYVIFIPAVDYESRGIVLTEEQLNSVKKLIKSSLHKIDNSRTNLQSVAEKGIQHYEPSDYRKDMQDSSKCDILSFRTNAFINYDGGVYLCQPHIGNQEYCIGNLNDATFKEIWNSSRHVEVIEKLDRYFSNGKCMYCRGIGFNKTIDKFKNNLLHDDFI
jgi:radical SAM protein with 4Fe4S-binding SPASM domain